MNTIITVFFFVVVVVVTPSYCNDYGEQLSACSSQYVYPCGSQTLNISYPFWGGNRARNCGGQGQGFHVRCEDNQYHYIEFYNQKFRVLNNISYLESRITIARDDIWEDYCPAILLPDTVLDHVHFNYGPEVRTLSLFHDCSKAIPPKGPNHIKCPKNGEDISGFYAIDVPEPELRLPNLTDTCKKVTEVPVQLAALPELRSGHLVQALKQGFHVEYNANKTLCAKCLATKGICAFICLCSDEPQPYTCPSEGDQSLSVKVKIEGDRSLSVKVKIVLGTVIFTVCGIMVTSIIICIFKRKKTVVFWKIIKKDRDLEAFIRNYGSLAPKRYSFSNVKKMTNSFKDKLGQGGYGGVYKGKLKDGQLIAVKVLNTSKGNGQDFINEVASISRTSHVNVVTLLGFCLEGSKRALIYEFMPNGSLEKFIHMNDTLKTNRHLGWEKLYQIALGIARGLEYLHRGCNTRILHFDIKPHNILLDESFCPKISDFGLAKLCPKNESIVSMLEARGTIGYIAPEVVSRNFGEVSHKSDVYSYGMMVLEMVGGRKNLHLGVDNSSEIYFPKWVYKHLEVGEEIKLCDATSREENEIAKKMIIVGLWCIQTPPLERPSMNKVIDMLQGSIEALQIPPNPFHSSSPPRSTLTDSSTIPMP